MKYYFMKNAYIAVHVSATFSHFSSKKDAALCKQLFFHC